MPTIKSDFVLTDDEIEKLQLAMTNSKNNLEKIINNYLHNNASEQMISSITQFIPVSKKGTRHAKTHEWYEKTIPNLAFTISNNLKGKRGTSFYYLYYVVTGTGTSKKKGANDFFEKGSNKIHNKIVEELINEINEKGMI